MHRALYIQEILLAIFGYCYPTLHSPADGVDIVSLARTCRVFKEPALDVLWETLGGPTPLIRCLPDVCHLDSSNPTSPRYLFKRRLNNSDREIVKSYACRVRALDTTSPRRTLRAFQDDSESLADLWPSSTADPLFPNIRRLHLYITYENLPLIHHVALPRLRWLSLHIFISDIPLWEGFFHSLRSDCPGLKMLSVSSMVDGLPIGALEICSWSHLQVLDCSQVSLDLNSLSHLSHVSGLTELSFMLSHGLTDQITSSGRTFTFSALQSLEVIAESLVIIPELFANISLPAVRKVSTYYPYAPPAGTITKSFSLALAQACSSRSTLSLFVSQHATPLESFLDVRPSMLVFEDIHLLASLNLTELNINFDRTIDLKDSDLLDLTSACGGLSTLAINNIFGWRAPGISPTTLVRMFQQCPFLSRVSVALDTRGYNDLTWQAQDTMSVYRHDLSMNTLDSVIEAEAIPTMAAFFADHFPQLEVDDDSLLQGWLGGKIYLRSLDWEVYHQRWKKVRVLARKALLERSR